ncbi:tetratricopeptide repeat protein [Luteimonas soli]|uniref:Tetratricopeptide repeat protein n=1 Tax=Luteimonas soli TaxID=1648966 RepID=A0ABV7XJ37_9GAMM
MSKSFPVRHALSAAVLALFLTGAATETFAQSASEAFNRKGPRAERKAKEEKAQAKAEAKYPDATREEPEAKASAKLSKDLKKIFDAYEEGDSAKVVPLADEMIANEKANAYERSISARLAAASLIGEDDAKAMAYLGKALEFNGLNNNEHYDSMLMLGQLQMQSDDDAAGLATLDKLVAETKTTNPDVQAIRGNALYRLERYPEAITALKQAIDTAGADAKPEWQQLLMASYFDSGKAGEAASIAEAALAKNPDDKKLQMNLASIYMQADQNDKAIALLEKMRASGQLTEDRDYRNLFALYLNSEGREKEGIAVIKEGMEKGVLKPDYQTYLALGQAYYFTDQPGPAIENYRKAAEMAPDGEAYLNLARILWGEGQLGEAKQAAQKALDKGVKKPEEARKILAQKG